MNLPRNTAADDTLTKFMVALEPEGAGILAQEAQSQRELLASTRLPTEVLYAEDADFEALGFTFGPPDSADPMFRDATLPKGWKREGSDHAMWSYVVDERGFRRVSVFYKAAFYDRSAHMGLVSVGSEVASKAIYDETGEATIPWEKLTEDERADALARLRGMLTKVKEHPSIYGKHADRTAALLATAP